MVCVCVCVCGRVCGQGAQSIYQPYSLCKKAVQHPGCSAADAPVPLPGWQEGEQSMRGVMEIPDNGSSSVGAALLVDLLQEGQRGTNDSAGCFHYPVELLLFVCLAAPEPGSETVCENAFNGTSIKGSEVRSGQTCLPEPPEGVETPLGFFDDRCGVC